MITFYHKEDKLFDNINDVKEFAKQFTDKRFDTYHSDNDFKTIVSKYELAREQGNSILASLEFAKETDEEEEFLNFHWSFNGGDN